jgi:ADP-heptose:LPS heptosyltransferase
VTNDALGNYVVATPLLQMLKAKYADGILHYYGGTRTQELWSQDPAVDWGFPLFGSEPSAAVRAGREALDGQEYDLIVNVESLPWAKAFSAAMAAGDTFVSGPCLSADGRGELSFGDDERARLWGDQDWISSDLTEKYAVMQSGFIGEIFCRLAYLNGSIPSYRVAQADPGQAVPDVLIATSASLPEKLWPVQSWMDALRWVRERGLTAGLLGAKPSSQKQFWKGASDEDELVTSGLVEDLRGQFSLPQVVGALAKANAVLTLDNGILHLAAATPTPTVGLFRRGIHRLWAPPAPNVAVLTAPEGGAVADIRVDEATGALARAL